MNLAERAPGPEILDVEDPGEAEYGRVMDDLASVSRVLMAHAPTLGFLHRVTRGRPSGEKLSVLDVGCGEGDLLRRLRAWSRHRAFAVELHGLDLNPRSQAAARARTPDWMAINYRTGDVFACDEQFDIVVSSLFTHHLTDTQLVAFLRWMGAHARLGWFVNDLQRHPVAYHSFGVLARLLRWHRIVRLDGQTSVRRAFRHEDWQRLLAQSGVAGRIRPRPMFRLCVEGKAG